MFWKESRSMPLINPELLMALAALLTSMSALIWSLRRKS